MKDDIFLGMKIEYAKSVPAFWRRVVRWDVHTCSLTWRNVRRTRRQQIPSRYAVECTKSCRSPWTSCRGVASGRPSRPDPISYDQLQHPLVGVAALGEIMRPNILFDVRGACSSVIVHDMWARLFWLMCIKCCSGVRCCAKIIFGRASFAHTCTVLWRRRSRWGFYRTPRILLVLSRWQSCDTNGRANADESTSTRQCNRRCVRDPAPLGLQRVSRNELCFCHYINSIYFVVYNWISFT